MTPLQAGWQLVDEPERLRSCPGSGQTVAPWGGRFAECPACGQRIAAEIGVDLPVLVTHAPASPEAQPIDLWSAAR